MGRAVGSLLVLVVLGVLAWAVVYRFRSDRKRPGYANTEEIRAVRTVIAAAFWSLEKGDPRFRPMRMLRARVSGLYGLNYLDAEQVALIAPFIEQWLSVTPPHLLAPEPTRKRGCRCWLQGADAGERALAHGAERGSAK